MSTKHIRIDERSKDFLRRLAIRNDKKMSETAGSVFDVFEDFLQEIDDGSEIVIVRKNGDKVRHISSILRRKKDRKNTKDQAAPVEDGPN